MTDSNKYNLPIKFAPPVAPEEYLSNKDKISELKAFISAYEEMNEAGKKSHDEFTRELEQKIREGERASKLLSQLRAQSTAQLPLSMLIQRPAIDYPPSTSGIEEVPNYNPGSGHPQQVRYDQFQATNNRQTHNFMAQPVAISSYQQYNPPQWTSGNANGGQLQEHLQQPTMQNISSRHFSLGPPPDSQQLPQGQDRGNCDNHSRPMAPMQDQSVVSSRQDSLHYGNLSSSQGQRHTIPAQASGPSSHARYTSRPQHALQSSSTQNLYPHQTRAAASDTTHSQRPLPHKMTDAANQSQPTTTPTAPRPVVRDPQRNASSSNSAVGTSPNRIVQDNPNGDRPSFSNQNTSHAPHPPSLMPTTLPSMNMSYTQFIRELREAVENWEVRVPPNSYVDHPSNHFRVHKDLKGVTHIIVFGHGQSRVTDLDQFCDWIKSRNTTTSVTPAVPEISQTGSSSKAQKATLSTAREANPSTAHKVIPSTLHSASVQTTSSISQLQLATPHRPDYLQPGSSSSKQTAPTMSPSMPNQGIASLNRQMAMSFASSPPGSSTSMSVPHLNQPPLPSAQAPSFVSIPKTPSRQLSTIVNGVPRSAQQADKKSLASHILFGLGKRPREPNTSPSALTEPQSKRHAQGPTGQVGVGVSPSASHIVGQASRNPNVPVQITPYGASITSSSLQQSPQYVFTPPTIPQETHQISSQALAVACQQQLVNAALEMPSTSRVAEVLQVSDHQTPLSLQDANIVSSDPRQEIISDDRPVTSPGHYVPLATSPTLPSPVPLAVPVVVSSELSSEVNEKTTQPVASSAVKQPQPDTSTKLQYSFTGVPTPSRTSPQTPQKNQPLFLPSPASSPGIVENDDTSAPEKPQSFDPHKSSSSVGRKNRAYVLARRSFYLLKSPGSVKRKKNRPYVLVPPRPPYLVKYLSRASLKKRMTSRSSVSTSVAGEEDFYNATKSHSPSYDHEQQAVQLACTRLQELSCKWDGCSVKMNSVDALICHLNRQHKPSSTSHSNSFLCRWSQCGRRCSIHLKHLEKHASLPLNCPYKDCEESFRSAPPLWRHMRIEHRNDTVKPSARPSYVEVNLPDAFLGVVPSFMITTREVNPDEISSARHALLGPRVLDNIAGLARERSRNKLKKTVRSSNGDIIADEDTSNDYDFLTARPIRYSSRLSQSVDMRLDDLDSENISRMVDEGLTLWGGDVDKVPASDREYRSDQ